MRRKMVVFWLSCSIKLHLIISGQTLQHSQMEQENVEKIVYISYNQLPMPEAEKIAQSSIDLGFSSSEWFIQFHTLTHLRQANRHYASVFLNQLLPLNYKQILLQIENLRSTNSKEALTLVSEIFEQHKLEGLDNTMIGALVAGMMIKTVCQKGFLRSQAVKGMDIISKKWNEGALEELCIQTESANGQISQTAIQWMSEMIKNNKNYESDEKFLKNLSHNLNGKRAVLQKRAKEILNSLKQRQGEEKLEKKINSSHDLLEQESNTLRRQLKQKEQKPKGPSFKQFLKLKKQES